MKAPVQLPMVLPLGLGRKILMVLLGLPFFIGGGLMLWSGLFTKFNMTVAGIGGGFLAVGLFALLRLREQLILDETGFCLRQAFSPRRHAWTEIESFFLGGSLDSPGNKRIYVHFIPDSGKAPGESGEISFQAYFRGYGPTKLVELLNQLRMAHQPVPPLSEDQLFGLALSAMQTAANQQRHDCLHGDIPGRFHRKLMGALLEESWGIRNGAEARRMLQWLDTEGHRDEYGQIREMLAAKPDIIDPLELLAPETRQQLKGREKDAFVSSVHYLRTHGERHPSIHAWDYCRLVAVARLAAAAGFILDEEAWHWIRLASTALKARFASWQEMSENYIVGRGFWSGGRNMDIFDDARQFLLQDPSSPWTRLAWKQD